MLGGIGRQTRETFFQIVTDRSAETLLPILIENIHPDSLVISDCWKSYANVSKYFSEHKMANHSLHFVDPNDSKVHTNSIESQWRVLKRSVLPKNGTSKQLYSSYFSMYCVKRRYLTDVPCEFKAFLDLVKRVYRLKALENIPRNDLLNAASTDVSSRPTVRSIGVGTEPPRKRSKDIE